MNFRRINDVIAVDCDQVVLCFISPFERIGSELLGRPLKSLNNSYSLADRYNITENDVTSIFEAMEKHPQGARAFPALDGSIEALKTLQNNGLKLHMVTAVRPSWHDARLENMENHGIKLDGLFCVGVSQSKVDVVRKLNPFGFVDDRLPVLNPLDFVLNRIWIDHGDCQSGYEMNQMNKEQPHSKIFRYTSLKGWVDDLYPSVAPAKKLKAPSY